MPGTKMSPYEDRVKLSNLNLSPEEKAEKERLERIRKEKERKKREALIKKQEAMLGDPMKGPLQKY